MAGKGGLRSTSWKKGQSGNPKGPPRSPLSDALRKAVAKTITTKTGKKVIIQDAMAEAMVGEAIKGDVQAFNAVANRLEGMPKQDMKIDGEMTIEGVIIYKPEKNKE